MEIIKSVTQEEFEHVVIDEAKEMGETSNMVHPLLYDSLSSIHQDESTINRDELVSLSKKFKEEVNKLHPTSLDKVDELNDEYDRTRIAQGGFDLALTLRAMRREPGQLDQLTAMVLRNRNQINEGKNMNLSLKDTMSSRNEN